MLRVLLADTGVWSKECQPAGPMQGWEVLSLGWDDKGEVVSVKEQVQRHYHRKVAHLVCRKFLFPDLAAFSEMRTAMEIQ